MRRPPSGSGWATIRKWSPSARIQSSSITSCGAGEPLAPLRLPDREVADFGQPVALAHPLQHAVELGTLGEPFGIELGHDREGLVEEAHGAVRIELDRARRHAVGKVALRLDVARELGARVLQLLHVDREARRPHRSAAAR